MGQRHQIFLHMPSPLTKLKEEFKFAKKYNTKKEDLEKISQQIKLYEASFGKGELTTGCWHNQWLYGKSALLSCLNVLFLNKYSNDSYSNPFHKDSRYQSEEIINLITHILGIFNNKLAHSIGRCGLENFHFLNFETPEMRTDCKNFNDNNDGITVIDTTKNAYAFLNITTGDSTVSQLPEMIPCTAGQYLRLYYPQCLEDSSTVNIPEDSDAREKYFNDNIRMNRIFIRQFQPYRLLTKNEIIKMFPDSFKIDMQNSNINE